MWSNTAFTDEALYIRAGHLEIAHLLHGAAIPAYATYFSGAPVVYPPLAALADTIGGLAAARILSLLFMLGATALLWGVARRLYGRWAAITGSSVFALLGATLRLGAFATFDAMSLLLIALSVWCVVRSIEKHRASGWLVAAALALAAANATKYPSALFDPVVVTLAALLTVPLAGVRQALARAATFAAYLGGILGLLLTLGGGEYLRGIDQTTVVRVQGTSSARAVLDQAWSLTGVVAVLGALAVVTALWVERSWSRRLLVLVLVASVTLVPAEQARISTTTSLNKHLDFGAWFAAVGVGYLVAALAPRLRRPSLQRGAITALLAGFALAGWVGLTQAQAIFRTWPNSAALVNTLARILPATSGPILDDDNRSLAEYYLPSAGNEWYRWSNDTSLRLPHGKSASVPVAGVSDTGLFLRRIASGYFSLLVLNFTSGYTVDERLLPALEANTNYQLVAEVPYGRRDSQVWEYRLLNAVTTADLAPVSAPSTPLGSFLTPGAHTRPVLGTLGTSVIVSGLAVAFMTVLVRFGWRRGKASDEI